MAFHRGKMRYTLVFLFVVLAANFLMAQAVMHNDQSGKARPDGKGGVVIEAETEAATGDIQLGPIGDAVVTGNGINYHDGPGMKANPVHLYLISYGNWTGTGAKT